MIKRLSLLLPLAIILLTACEDNDSFSTSQTNLLSFTTDTLEMDTVFSTESSPTYSFWVHNKSGDGIRIQSSRLERGTQSVFRVNVNGVFLNPVGYNFEVRKGDSIRVFVEVTPRETSQTEPQEIEDNLLFQLESGQEQRVNLRAYSWDAVRLNRLVVERDTTIESARPILVTGDSIRVKEGVTLTLRNTTLYFSNATGIDVQGGLVADNCIFRGDRLDNLFDYLPYDRLSGLWGGIRLHAGANGVTMTNCEIRNACDALICDSTVVDLTQCVIHNNRGYGLQATHCDVSLSYCQLTNTLGDCLALDGSVAIVDHTTLAQFYPFSASRGAALRFVNTSYPMVLKCTHTLVTGYEDDVVMGEMADTTIVFDYYFADCLLRTDSVADAERFERIIWETPKDSVQGKQHFVTIDEENFYYDFTVDSISPAFSRNIGRYVVTE